MPTLDCTLPQAGRFSVKKDASGTAHAEPDPRGRYLRAEALEIADLQNRIYRVRNGTAEKGYPELGYVNFARPGTGGIHVAYSAAAPGVGKEFDTIQAAIDWIREGKS